MPKLYRIRHKETGLYFCPSRRIYNKKYKGYVKSNLSKSGKIYHSKPSVAWYRTYYNPYREGVVPKLRYRDLERAITVETGEEDFEVVEVELNDA